jgi:hypothetical protein
VKVKKFSQVLRVTPVIPATPETEVGGSCFECSLGKKLARPYLKNERKAKGLEVRLK